MIARIRRARRRFAARLAAVLALAVVLPASLTACSGLFGGGETLRVLAGSEVKDLEPLLEDMTRETGVRLEFEYIGTLDGTEALLASGDDRPWDATWFPSNRYLTLFPDGQDLIRTSESIARSPVVLGLKPAVAQRLGWGADSQPTWNDVVDAIAAGELSYGMTSPISSNSGFTTLVQMTTALSGTGTVLETGDIAATAPLLERFAQGQGLASGSSGWLLDRFVEDPGAVDGIFNYESVLAGVEVEGAPLELVIPSDGVVTSDYPLTLLASADDEAAERYEKVVEWLLRDDVQERIAEDTNRRTTATPPALDAQVFELPFPNRVDTVQTLLQTWLAEVKKPSNMVFAIDTSGSMGDGTRMDELRAALDVLAGSQEAEGSAGFLRLQPRERITFLEFAGTLKSEFAVDIPADDAGYAEAIAEIDAHVRGYSPTGGTAMYDTVAAAYEAAVEGADDDSISSIVVFTDGESNQGMSDRDFERWYEDFVAAHPAAERIPVFTVHFGDSNEDELEALAELTGGRLFDAKSESLAAAFREIRGYL